MPLWKTLLCLSEEVLEHSLRRSQVRIKSVPFGFRKAKLEQWVASLSSWDQGPRKRYYSWRLSLWDWQHVLETVYQAGISAILSQVPRLYPPDTLLPYMLESGSHHLGQCSATDSQRTVWTVYLKDFCTHVKLWILNITVWFHTS